MFDLPFPGSIEYRYSPVTRPNQLASESSAQDDSLDSSTLPVSDLEFPERSQLLGGIDEEGFESFISSPLLDNADFLGRNESESSATLPKNSPEQQEIIANKLRKRKGHKKSRNGCYNCKKRKIKCPENHPACHNCTKVKLDCRYPPLQVICAVESSSLERNNLQSTPTVFDATDMRLFHHFLMNCYPHLPLGNDSVWTRDIAAFAHSVSLQVPLPVRSCVDNPQVRLPHASYARPCRLSSNDDLKLRVELPSFVASCPSHKRPEYRAIHNPQMRRRKRRHPGDYVGTFLSNILYRRQHRRVPGHVERLHLDYQSDWRDRFGTAFQNCTEGGQEELITPRLEPLPLIDQDLVAEAKDSFERLRDLDMNKTENDVFEYMFDMVRLLSISSLQGMSSSCPRRIGLICLSVHEIQGTVLLSRRDSLS